MLIQVNAQSSFSLLLDNTLNELPSAVLELNSHNYLVSYGSSESFQNFSQDFLVIDENGQEINSLKIIDPDGSCGIGEFYRLNDSTFMGIGI